MQKNCQVPVHGTICFCSYFISEQVAPSTALAASLQAILLVKQPRPETETHQWVDELA
jgi:hypothetical protein